MSNPEKIIVQPDGVWIAIEKFDPAWTGSPWEVYKKYTPMNVLYAEQIQIIHAALMKLRNHDRDSYDIAVNALSDIRNERVL